MLFLLLFFNGLMVEFYFYTLNSELWPPQERSLLSISHLWFGCFHHPLWCRLWNLLYDLINLETQALNLFIPCWESFSCCNYNLAHPFTTKVHDQPFTPCGFCITTKSESQTHIDHVVLLILYLLLSL